MIILGCILLEQPESYIRIDKVDCSVVTEENNEQELVVQSLEQDAEEIEADMISIHEIPDYPGKKTFMSDSVFGKTTQQYKLQCTAVADENGLKVVDGRYCIAIGSRFQTIIGQYVDLYLLNGTVIPCIVGDLKSDKHTDSTHTFSPNKCCSEFIVDMSNLEKNVKKRGDVSFINEAWQSPVKYIVVYKIVKEDL